MNKFTQARRKRRRRQLDANVLLWCVLMCPPPLIHVSSFAGVNLSEQRFQISLLLNFNDFSEFELESVQNQGNLIASDQSMSTFPKLQQILSAPPISYPIETSNNILNQLKNSGFIDDNDVTNFGKGFATREEVLSQILMQDFAWGALDAHRARVGIIELVCQTSVDGALANLPERLNMKDACSPKTSKTIIPSLSSVSTTADETKNIQQPLPKTKVVSWKSVLVNDKAKLRRSKQQQNEQGATTNNIDSYSYGLASTDRGSYPILFEELDNYWTFMTVPQASVHAQPPIREKTAEVYRTHARLFLGWALGGREDDEGLDLSCNNDIAASKKLDSQSTADRTKPLLTSSSLTANYSNTRDQIWNCVSTRHASTFAQSHLTADEKKAEFMRQVSLIDIFPDTSTKSATCVLNYILWLRSERVISSNYEANILRGLIKLVKFRFASVLSDTDILAHTSKSKNTSLLDDLPIVMELRRLHRDAGQRAKKGQRSSDEGKKWLEWDDYLEVIELLKSDLMAMIERYETESNTDGTEEKKGQKVKKKDIATIFQHYLILSFFASVPDRQRTFRELELGRSFLRIDQSATTADGGIWVIKHSSEDYKTGSTYGERPPLPLPSSLTPFIDDFINQWRPAILSSNANPSSSFLFLQPRTGNPLTQNSIYQIVSRCCYKYKGRKTNPHLLRDMIVTHIRKNADASEKELEALALFMGHSVAMQRETYDRRTLEQKIEPAIQMMQQMMMPDSRRLNK